MTTQIFDYTVTALDYGEFFSAAEQPVDGGVTLTRDEYGSAYGLYSVKIDLLVGQGTPKTFAQWLTFIRALRGANDVFLWKDPLNAALRAVTNQDVSTGISSLFDFPLPNSCIDAATLVVKDNGTPTTAYTLLTNYTTPTVRLNSGLGAGHTITVSYEFYYPVRFVTSPPLGTWSFETYLVRDVSIVEDYPEAHRYPYG